MKIWISPDAKIYSTRNIQFCSGNQEGEMRETTCAHECNLPCAALRVIGREVRIGKLSPGRLSYPSVSDTGWYSEEY
jgi:hypothetical protein